MIKTVIYKGLGPPTHIWVNCLIFLRLSLQNVINIKVSIHGIHSASRIRWIPDSINIFKFPQNRIIKQILSRIVTKLHSSTLSAQVYSSDAKDQGVCSACSAFSTVAALETCVQRFDFNSPRVNVQHHIRNCFFQSWKWKRLLRGATKRTQHPGCVFLIFTFSNGMILLHNESCKSFPSLSNIWLCKV